MQNVYSATFMCVYHCFQASRMPYIRNVNIYDEARYVMRKCIATSAAAIIKKRNGNTTKFSNVQQLNCFAK